MFEWLDLSQMESIFLFPPQIFLKAWARQSVDKTFATITAKETFASCLTVFITSSEDK